MDHLTRILLAARDGDAGALERFVAETQADVWRLCRYLGDDRDADDLSQETYERAIGSLHRYRADGPARGWLLTIARRVCADHTRKAQRRRRRDAAVKHDAGSGDGTGVVLNADDSGQIALDDMLAALSEDRRAAFVLTQVLGLYYDEAAEILNCPIGTIRSRVARARLDLVEMFERPDTGDMATSSETGAARTSRPPTGTEGPGHST